VVLLLAVAPACAGEPTPTARHARAHLDALARTIGYRPVGTPGNRRAREYLIGELERIGFAVRVQDAEAVHAERGATTRVANLIATRGGSSRDAIGLISHYDSSPFAPGAADAALGVAVVLESARLLASGPGLRHTLMVLFTDGEEAGLMGARAFVDDAEAAGRLKAYLNLEALGPSGPSVLFETGDGALVDAWRRAAPFPRGTSYALDIYKRLPNDTDFTVFNARGVRGLNFATVGESAVYHTARDTPDRVSDQTLEESVANTVAIVRELDALNLSAPPGGDRVFFDVLSVLAFSYGTRTARVLAAAALMLAALAWMRLVSDARVRGRLRTGAITAAWSVIAIAALAGLMIGLLLALRAVHGTIHPWYAHPDRLLALLALASATAVWAPMRWAGRWPAGLRGSADPRIVWLVALPIWIVAAGALEMVAPSASYLWVVPLLAAGLGLLPLPLGWPALVRLASLAVLGIVAALWMRDTRVLHGFLIEQLARQPIRPPAFVYIVLPLAAGIMLGPPVIAALGGPSFAGAKRRAGRLLALATLAAAMSAALAPSYTFDRPLRRSARYVSDGATGTAFWEVGSLEARLELDETVPDVPRGWQRVDILPPAAFPATGLRRPFLHRAPAPARPFPGEVHVGAAPLGGALAVDVTVVAPEESEIAFAVPSSVPIERPSLTGAVRRGYWLASYGGAPVGGVSLRFELAREDLDRLADAAVIVTRARLGSGPEWQGLPRWLPRERAVWAPLEVFVRPVADDIRRAAAGTAPPSLR
jgi:hypothetical protein